MCRQPRVRVLDLAPRVPETAVRPPPLKLGASYVRRFVGCRNVDRHVDVLAMEGKVAVAKVRSPRSRFLRRAVGRSRSSAEKAGGSTNSRDLGEELL